MMPMKALAILSAGGGLYNGFVIDTRGVDLALVEDGVPILDSHGSRKLGWVTEAWLEDVDGVLPMAPVMGHLQFDDSMAGLRAYGMVERGELCHCSIRIEITEMGISDARSGAPLGIEEALARGCDDPDVLFIALRSVLKEVSLVNTPCDPDCVVRVVEDVRIEMMHRTAHPFDYDQRFARRHAGAEPDRDELFQRVLNDPWMIHHGAAEPLSTSGYDRHRGPSSASAPTELHRQIWGPVCDRYR
jgi:hypothetical protein